MKPAAKSDLVTICRLLRHARPYWGHIGLLLVVSLLSTPLALLAPVPLKLAVDSVIGSEPLPNFLAFLFPESVQQASLNVLIMAAGLVVGITLIQQAQTIGSQFLSTYIGQKVVMRFRAQLFHHAQHMSLSKHDLNGTHDSIHRINHDSLAIQWIAVNGLIQPLILVVTFAAMIFVMAKMDPYLALVALIVVPIIYLSTYFYRPALRQNWKEVWDRRSDAFSVVQEALTSLRVVKAFGQEGRERERLVIRSQETVNAHLKVTLRQSFFNSFMGITTAVGTAIVLFLGFRHVQEGVLTLGDLLIVMAYLTQVYGPLTSLGQMVAQLQGSLANADRTFRLLDEPPDVREGPNARPVGRASGAIEFRDVSFSYDGKHPVLHNISLEVAPGIRIGIAGGSGAGKTTLTSLLTRFFDPTSGEIFLDGMDLRDLKLADLRNQFAIVLQEPVLFSTSIAENIGYGRPDASFSEIVSAAKAANAHKFITRLPDGYDTMVGERGMMLSGGERQRISLARAFLKDAPILVLDEPTSSVDMTTETAIFDAMENLMAGRTTFMIAHRLTTLEACDVLMVLENGRLITVTTEVMKTLKAIGSAKRPKPEASELEHGTEAR